MKPTLKEAKMGLNTRDIQLRLLKMLHVSFEISYIFIQRHPFVSLALLIFFVLYICLSFIYNLLVFLSPFFVCTAIFVRIFWSSEQNHLISVKQNEKKREEKSDETKISSEMLRNERRGVLYKCPSQNATSRRRNFTGKRLDVYGGLEIKAKDLSSVFRNEFTKINKEFGRDKFDKEEIGSLEAPKKQVLFAEPSMLDLMSRSASYDCLEKMAEKREDEKKALEGGSKGELTEDEQKSEMELGTCELERHKRLENLIARRRARKQWKLQIEKGLVDMKSVTPSQIAPLFVSRLNPLDSPREIDGIQMPGSAPSSLRSPFDIPYDPFEEKPILTGDSFDQELKGLLLEPRQEDHEGKVHRLAHPRVTRLQGKGNHDKLEQLIFKAASESEPKASMPSSEGEETRHEENGKCEIVKRGDITGEEVDNAQATMSMSNHDSNVETAAEVSEKLEETSVPKPQEGDLNLPLSSTTATKINDSLYGTLSPNKEAMSFTGRRNRHNPSYSLASDLQVELSEIGSPRVTLDENHQTTTTSDEESIIYDGDIEKDVTSGSEDMWGASLHSREVRKVNEQDISELNKWKDISSPLSMRNMDEENAADVSSRSSVSDIPDDNNIFGNMKDFGPPRNSHPSGVSERWKRLMRMMDTRVNHLPHGKHSKKLGDLFNFSENSSKAQVTNEGNNSTASEQDNTHNSRGNEELGASDSVMQKGVTDEISINSSSSSSPRSVLSITQKTISDQVPSSACNQERHQDVQQSNMQGVSQETSNIECPPDFIPQNIQPSMEDPNVESHKSDLSHPQDQTFPPEKYIQESNMSSKMNDAEVRNKEDEIKKNDENSGDKLTPLIIPHDSAERPKQTVLMDSKDISEESREKFGDNVPLISLILQSSLESQGEEEYEQYSQASVRQEAATESNFNAETTDTSSDEDFERKHSDLHVNEAIHSSSLSAGESDKLKETDEPKHSLEEVNYSQSESKQDVVEDHMEKEKLDKGDIAKDSSLPIASEVTNSKDTEEEHGKINKSEATDHELNKNEAMVTAEPGGESDQVKNTAQEKDPEEMTPT